MGKPAHLSRQALWRTPLETVWDADRFDLADWLSAQDAIPTLAPSDEQASRELCGHPVQEGFFSLFKSNPQLITPPPSGLEPLSDLLQRGIQTPEWTRLRETTVGDTVAAGVGASAFVEETLKALPNEVKQQAKRQAQEQRQADEARAEAQSLLDLAHLLKERAQQENSGEAQTQAEDLEAKAHKLQAQAAQAQARAQTARQAYQAMAGQQAAQIAAALNTAARQATEQATETAEMVRGFSLAAGGDGQTIDPEVARAAMQALQANPHLKRLAEMLGWAKRMVRGEWRKSPRARTQLVGYETRSLQPERMAGFEWASLLSGDETLRADWLRRALDGGIRHRKYSGQEQLGRGPLIIVRDESGSMAGAPHALAVALEWALLEIARRDRRELCSLPFSGQGQFQVWQAPSPGKPDPQGLLAHLSHFYGAGTEPYGPLAKTLSLIESVELRSDILILTDADFDSPPPEFLAHLAQVRQRLALRVVAVVIGASADQAEAFADKVIHLDDLVEEREGLKQAVAAII